MKRVLGLVLAVFVGWLGLTFSSQGRGSNLQLESRLDRLESELSRVRSRLNQLEARSDLRQTVLPPSATVGSLNDPSLAEQFENLATLAVELKQDVRDLQSRVAELETASRDR